MGSAIAAEVAACTVLPANIGEIASDPVALRIFWEVLARSRYGFSELEEAAFIVRDTNGTVTSIPWPAAEERNLGRWVGAFPANTIAIVHTHPNWMPLPSAIDIRTAKRSHMAVYVITRSHIAKTENGSITMLIDGEWRPSDVCGAGDGRVDLAETRARRTDGSRGERGAGRWPWSAWQRGSR